MSIFGKGESAGNQHFLLSPFPDTKLPSPHSSDGSVQELRTGGRWFVLQLGQYSFRELMTSHCDRIHCSLTTVHCLDYGYVGNRPVAWEEYIVCSTAEKNSRKALRGALAAAI